MSQVELCKKNSKNVRVLKIVDRGATWLYTGALEGGPTPVCQQRHTTKRHSEIKTLQINIIQTQQHSDPSSQLTLQHSHMQHRFFLHLQILLIFLFFFKGKWYYNNCRTTRSCIIGPYHQGCRPDSIEKDS